MKGMATRRLDIQRCLLRFVENEDFCGLLISLSFAQSESLWVFKTINLKTRMRAFPIAEEKADGWGKLTRNPSAQLPFPRMEFYFCPFLYQQ